MNLSDLFFGTDFFNRIGRKNITGTELAALINAQVAEGGTFMQNPDGSPTQALPSFLVDGLPDGVTESIGPTGSGADNIWTALDGVPLSARWIEVRIATSGLRSGGTPGTSQRWAIFAQRNGVSRIALNETLIQDIRGIVNAAGDAEASDVVTTKLPVNAANIFDFQTDSTWGSNGSEMWLTGFE